MKVCDSLHLLKQTGEKVRDVSWPSGFDTAGSQLDLSDETNAHSSKNTSQDKQEALIS